MAKKSPAKKKAAAKPGRKAARTSAARKTRQARPKAKAAKRGAAKKPAKAAKKRDKKPGKKATPGKAQARRAAAAKKTPAKAAGKARKPAAKKTTPGPLARKRAAKAVPARRRAAAPAPAAPAAPARPAPALNRERKRVTDAPLPSAPSTLGSRPHASAANSGVEELRGRLAEHTASGPEITAGDVDANWEAAETVGDEAPGGDNPTPDQDVVDEIGRALGVEYDDDEELQGGDEIAARDHNRWELDPASSDDFDER